MPIPYRAVATDIETGKEVVLSSGSLAKSIRASMAVPAAFDPVEIDGRLLVDGGLANNVPVSVARDMKPKCSSSSTWAAGCTSAMNSTMRWTSPSNSRTSSSRSTRAAVDVARVPGRPDSPGAGRYRRQQFRPRRRDDSDRRKRGARGDRILAEVFTQPGGLRPARGWPCSSGRGPPGHRVCAHEQSLAPGDAVIASRITAKTGQPLDVAQLEEDIGHVYGLDIFESVRYDVVREEGKTGLEITATEALGPGVPAVRDRFLNDLKGDNTLRTGFLYTRTALNPLNGEWRAGMQFGDEPAVFTEFHQPLDPCRGISSAAQSAMKAQRARFRRLWP